MNELNKFSWKKFRDFRINLKVDTIHIAVFQDLDNRTNNSCSCACVYFKSCIAVFQDLDKMMRTLLTHAQVMWAMYGRTAEYRHPFEPRTVSVIIRGAFGTQLTQHHQRQHCLQHASQAYLSSFKINACAQLRIIINNARRFYFQDLGKPRYREFNTSCKFVRTNACACILFAVLNFITRELLAMLWI